jgi:SAM-dependent methyltransferase
LVEGRPTSYTPSWFCVHSERARRSAERILPLVLADIPAESALDVGCGIGTWLAALRDLGVEDVVGIDGDYVDRTLLEISTERFVPLDLSETFDLGRTFDLALSLEVAEHLPVEAADGFIGSLVRHAPTILFSAAIPGQGGTDHLNERWPDYWAEKFAGHDFLAVDAIRPRIWTDPEVEFWYAQNAILYMRQDTLSAVLRPHVVENLGALSIVHPRLFDACREQLHIRRRRLLLEATIGHSAAERLCDFLGRGSN